MTIEKKYEAKGVAVRWGDTIFPSLAPDSTISITTPWFTAKPLFDKWGKLLCHSVRVRCEDGVMAELELTPERYKEVFGDLDPYTLPECGLPKRQVTENV